MFVPVLDDDEEDEMRHRGEDEIVRVEFVEEVMGVVIIKISNVLLLLSLVVAGFVQFCTLDPRYLNALMWGEDDQLYQTPDDATMPSDMWIEVPREEEELTRQSSKSLRTFQSIATVLLLSLIRAVVFPDQHRRGNNNNNATTSTLEAVLADCLFHIQCRLGIGFLTCVTPLPFATIETTVVCLSVALQIASIVV